MSNQTPWYLRPVSERWGFRVLSIAVILLGAAYIHLSLQIAQMRSLDFLGVTCPKIKLEMP